jgi:formamidopyrimidine-DNA glycosylase
MPELPEVETVRRTLAPAIGARVTGVWTSGKPLRLNQDVDRAKLVRAARGRTLEDIRRTGKYLLFDFAGSPWSILVHLGMSGRLRLMDPHSQRPVHTHVVFTLDRTRDQSELRYSDARRFGQVAAFERAKESQHPALAKLGLDPLQQELTGAYLHPRLRKSKKTIKTFLLDQQAVTGVGNIYASEALWHARIHPGTRTHRISRPRADALALAIRDVFDRALDHGGTSLRDFMDADGREGSHAHYLWVYDREGQPCVRPTCTGRIRRTVMANRSTFHCPACQKP